METQFKGICSITKSEKKYLHMVKQASMLDPTALAAPCYKLVYGVPRDYPHVVDLDQKNGKTRWQDTTCLEMDQLTYYHTSLDYSHMDTPPPGYKKIWVHLMYDVKHDERCITRHALLLMGHLTNIPVDRIYSSIISL